MSYVPQPVGVAALLCRELSGAAGGPPRVKLSAEEPLLDGYVAGGRGARSPYPYGQGMLLALETLGLLTSEQTAAWSRRFELAGEGWSPGPAAGSEQRRLADDHLRRLVRSLHEATDRHARRPLLDRLNGAFCFCLQTGLVGPEDAPKWATSIEEALGETLEQFETAEAGERLDADDPDEFAEPQDVDEPDFRPREPMGALVRVVPAEPARHEGLCVTAVALHEGGFEVHWHTLGMEPYDPDGGLYGERFEATDELGTDSGRPGRAGRSAATANGTGRSSRWGRQDAPPRYRRAHGNFASGGLPRNGWLDSPEPVRVPACLPDPPREQPTPGQPSAAAPPVGDVFETSSGSGGVARAATDKSERLAGAHRSNVLSLHPQGFAISPGPGGLSEGRGFIDRTLAAAGFDAGTRYQVTVATNEAVSNAMEHGVPCDDGHIHLAATVEDGSFVFSVRDCGEFEHAAAPTPDPVAERGRGFAFMNLLMDDVRLEASPGKTVLRLAKRLPGTPPTPREADPAAAEHNVGMVHELFDAFAARDVERTLELVDRGVMIEPLSTPVVRRSPYLGVGGLRRYLRDLDETWDEFDVTIGDTRADGVYAVAVGRVHARHRSVVLDDPVAFVFKFRDSKVVWSKFYWSEAEAVAAAGWA